MRLPAVVAITVAVGAAAPNPAAQQYRISRADSYLLAVTGKAGLFAFAGHEHAVTAPEWTAELRFDPQRLAGSSVALMIPVAGLKVDTPEARERAHLGQGPGPGDVRTIQARMLSPEILDAARYPAITFQTASATENGSGRLLLTGDLTLHGRTRRVSIPIAWRRQGTGEYIFDGEFKIRQTGFGLKPETAGGGTVKVKDEVQIRFRILLIPATP